MILRPAGVAGRISTARTQRGSVTGIGVSGLNQTSWPLAGIVYGVRFENEIRLRQTVWPVASRRRSATALGGGMSLGSPSGAPASTQRAMVAICSSVSEISFWKLLNADRLVQVPGRHVAGHHPLLDGFGPRPGFFVGDQRHGRHRSVAMAVLAFFLKDRRDVFGERWRGVGEGRPERAM